MGITDILKKFSWAVVSCVGLVLGSEKYKLEVKISRYSKPNLTTEVKLLEAAIVNFRSEV